ncbi:hypothetical protein B0H10DRAFT_1993809 [Mycena sp. CBHHK59/15]|nr:hypothetical protein B0H10DRAFT_1993809 [Mycena sp. CBHHK59/15]
MGSGVLSVLDVQLNVLRSPMLGPSIAAAELCALFIGSMVYGVYLVTLGIAARVSLTTDSPSRWRRRSEINRTILVVSIILFVNGTLDLILAMLGNMQAFVLYTGDGGPAFVFLHASSWENFLKTFAVGLQSLTGDAILIYRCWFIYRRSWRIILLPMLLWLGNAVCNGRLVYLQATLQSRALVTAKLLLPWGTAFWALTITVNICTTSLIVWRIWRVDKENEKFRFPLGSLPDVPPSALSRAMRNMIESGLLYTTAAVLTFAAYTAKSSLVYIASALELHSVGIAFNLIVIRGAKKSSRRNTIQTQIQFLQTEATTYLPTTINIAPEIDSDTIQSTPHSHIEMVKEHREETSVAGE